jgi:hypothetical protein
MEVEMERSCRAGTNVKNVWPFVSIHQLPSWIALLFKRDNLTLIEGNVFALEENI